MSEKKKRRGRPPKVKPEKEDPALEAPKVAAKRPKPRGGNPEPLPPLTDDAVVQAAFAVRRHFPNLPESHPDFRQFLTNNLLARGLDVNEAKRLAGERYAQALRGES